MTDRSFQIEYFATGEENGERALGSSEALISRQKLSRHSLFLLHTIHNPRLARVDCTRHSYTVTGLTTLANINIPFDSDTITLSRIRMLG